MAGDYEVRVITNRTSFTPIVLAQAVPGRPYRELNNWGTFDFQIPTLDSEAAECQPLKREVQVWRDGRCMWWGVIVRRDLEADPAWTRVQCYGLEWYFSRLYFGPIQTNYANNGSFDAGLSAWTATNCTATLDTSWKVAGTQSVKLQAATYGLDAYLGQLVSVSGFVDLAVAYKASAVWRFDPAAEWLGTAYAERGLYIDLLAPGNVSTGSAWEPITNDSQYDGSEVLVETPELSVPAGETYTLDLRLYCPGPQINWDLVSVRIQESVSTALSGEDVAVLLQRVVDYAQNGAGKSNLNIGFAYTPTGKHLSLRAYQFYDHGNIWEAFGEFITGGICDVGIVWNDAGTQRTFMVWPSPGRGSLKTDLQLDYDADNPTVGRIATLGFGEDGEQTASKVLALGQGTGATREVGEASDTTELDGLVLESVLTPPFETLIGALDGIASTELARIKAPVQTPKITTTTTAVDFVRLLDLGDTVPTVIDFGWVQENDTRRVVGISVDPETDTVEPTVN